MVTVEQPLVAFHFTASRNPRKHMEDQTFVSNVVSIHFSENAALPTLRGG